MGVRVAGFAADDEGVLVCVKAIPAPNNENNNEIEVKKEDGGVGKRREGTNAI
jgi:hypothetical protein